jgi:plastocyanin
LKNIKKWRFEGWNQHQKIRKPDGKIPNACKIEIMNVIVTIRFIYHIESYESIMASIDKAAIGFTMVIVAIALGFTASGGITQDAGPVVSSPQMVSPETSEPEASSGFGANLAAEIREKAGTVELEEEVMMEEEEEVMMKEEEVMMKEEVMEEPTGPTTVHVEIPIGTSVPGCEETNECWSPADITINAGDTVHWMNVDTAAHTVTGGSPADGPSGVFDSSLVMADATYEFTFDEAGSYDYFCMVHPWMVGSISVN